MSVSPMPRAQHHTSGWSVLLSVLLIIGGILAIVLPMAAGIAMSIAIGWILILGGIAHLVYAFHGRTFGGVVWQVVLGLLYFTVGIILLVNPVAGLASLTLVLGIYLLIESIIEFILAYELRVRPIWGWFLFDGVITLILAFLIWASWPWSAVWAIGMLVGFSILFSGIARLAWTLARSKAIQ